jgi:hypothetical protein
MIGVVTPKDQLQPFAQSDAEFFEIVPRPGQVEENAPEIIRALEIYVDARRSHQDLIS